MPKRDLKDLHRQAIERFKVVAASEEQQRQRELIDLKFADPIEPGDQWTTAGLSARKAMDAIAGLPPLPERPAMTINKLKPPIQQVQNQMRQTRLSLTFSPEGEGATVETAEVFADIARAIQTDSRAHLARQWAFDRGIRCGRGFYRIETEYVKGNSGDQKIVYKRILNQFSVYLDCFGSEPDWSDARYVLVTDDMPFPKYQREYPKSDMASMSDADLTATGDELKGWVRGEGTDEARTIRVAEYYFFDEDDDGERRMYWGKLNAKEWLEEPQERDGVYIPIVPFIANESNVNGERRFTGIVREAIDAQRLFNVEASTLAEVVHLAPRAPFIGYASQFQGYEKWWAQMNVRNFPYLPVNPEARDAAGSPLPLPQRNEAGTDIQAIVASLQQAGGYIHDTTGIPPVSLGELDPHDRSGKAILALQKQSEIGVSGYVDNLANMSMLLEGKILRDLIPKIYDRQGRMVAAEGDDKDRRTVLLNQPFLEQQGKPPQPVPPGTQGAKLIDLAAGTYAIEPNVGKSHTTRREEAADAMGQLAGAVPQMVPTFADIWVENMDFPGAKEIADRLSKMVPPQVKGDQQGPDPQQMQAQIQQAGQMIQMLSQELQAKTEIIQREQWKEDAETQRLQMKLAADDKKSQRDTAAKLIDTESKINAAAANTMVSEEYAAISAHLDRIHEAMMMGQQAQVDQQAAGQQQMADQQQASQQQASDQQMAGQQQDHERALAAQQGQQAMAQQASDQAFQSQNGGNEQET